MAMGKIHNPVPRRMARVFPTALLDLAFTLGPPEEEDAFATGASDIARIATSRELAQRLTLVDETGQFVPGPFAIIEFDTPRTGAASPIFRSDPGFSGRGRTAGGACEFVIPNLPISELQNVTIRVVP